MYGLGLVVFNLKTYRDFPFLISWWRFHELTIFPGKSALLPRRGYHLREKVRAKSLADCWLNVLLILFKIDSWMLVTSLSIFKNITHGVQHFRCLIGSLPASIHRFKEGLTSYPIGLKSSMLYWKVSKKTQLRFKRKYSKKFCLQKHVAISIDDLDIGLT